MAREYDLEKEQQEVFDNFKSCVKYGLLSEDAILKINDIMINELDTKKRRSNRLTLDDIGRDIESDCESGLCPVK